MFEKQKGKRFPDFLKDNDILDAKYKRLSGRNKEKIDRNDMHQIISYMYVKQAKLGGFICPSDEIMNEDMTCTSLGFLNGYRGEVKLWIIPIPQSADNYNDFYSQMNLSERSFENNIKLISE